MIADGDNSCYQMILESRPYKNVTVEKIECRNHLLRNYCNKLREVSTKSVPGSLKNIFSENILKARTAVIKAIQYRKNENSSEKQKIRALKKQYQPYFW